MGSPVPSWSREAVDYLNAALVKVDFDLHAGISPDGPSNHIRVGSENLSSRLRYD